MQVPKISHGMEMRHWGGVFAGAWGPTCVQAYVPGFACEYDNEAKQLPKNRANDEFLNQFRILGDADQHQDSLLTWCVL